MSFMETARLRAEMVRNWRRYAEKLAEAVRGVLPDAEALVFGSVARGEHIAASDVDILIISNEAPDDMLGRARIKVEIERRAGLPYYHPFELHIVRGSEAEPYLRRAGKHIIRM